ncbi:hypothetical protein [Thalassospira sp. MIT1370]|uniref:AbiU2 domain-containing protein n=1 Tax=unclassified Thalassospira TaxID=2648997 RepID=UPI00399B10DA
MNKSSFEFKYPVAECDVSNSNQLAEFREKYSEWITWFSEDEHHSICKQVNGIMWSDAVFRTLNESRRFSNEDSPTASTNAMLAEFIDSGFVSTQILSICKITDAYYGQKKKGIISLPRFIDDLKKHKKLLTRELYVCFDGLPYDYQTIRDNEYSNMTPEEFRTVRYLPSSGPKAWTVSQRLHDFFDRLSGVSSDNRCRTDLIDDRVFDTLESWLQSPTFEKLRTLRNKFTAHAADGYSREQVLLESKGISLDEIEEAQRALIRTANEIGSAILYHHGIGGPVPIPQFDLFKNLTLPFIPEKNIEELRDWWSTHEMDRESWLREDVNLLTGEISSL